MNDKGSQRCESNNATKAGIPWKYNSLKCDQDVLVFFNGGNILKLESLLSKAWAIEGEPGSNPSLNPKSSRPKPNSDPFVVFTGSTDKEW